MTQRRAAIIWRAVSQEVQAAEDKVSLEEQERAARQWCEANGYTVVAMLTIPGYSRYESDVAEALNDFRRGGITAYDELKRHWVARDFDVLVTYHPSRLGRSVALFAYAVENVVRSGAIIHCIQGGEINQSNFTMAYAMGSIQATQGISSLVAGRKAGMKKRAQRGLHTGSTLPFFHTYERDERFRPTRLVVDRERCQRLIDDLYRVVIEEQVNWDNVENRLAELGHLAPDGIAYPVRFFRDIILTPAFWGNIGTGYYVRGHIYKRRWWMVEPSDDMPAGVHMEYGVCEAVYSGDQAAQMKAELRRRLDLAGQARANTTHALSGLIVCGECGRHCSYNRSGSGWISYGCLTHYKTNRRMRSGMQSCSQRRRVSYADLSQFIHNHLSGKLEGIAQTGRLNPVEAPQKDNISLLESDLTRLDGQIRNLTVRLSSAPDSVLPDIYAQLEAIGQQREAIRSQLAVTQHQQTRDHQQREIVSKAAQAILDLGLPNLWELPEPSIHQMLHPLFTGHKVAILEGAILGIVKAQS